MSKKGTSMSIALRASAVLLIPLGAWLLYNIVVVLGADYLAARAWVNKPLNAALIGAFIILAAWHTRIGMTDIIVDYIHDWLKDVLLFINWLISLSMIAAAVWAMYNLLFVG